MNLVLAEVAKNTKTAAENKMLDKNLYKYGKDITWSLPVLFQYEPIWGAIYKMFAQYGINLPEINAFGSPTLAWTGGRAPAVTGEFDTKTLLKIFNYLAEINAVPALTFTYTKLTKEDLNDKYANYFLDIAEFVELLKEYLM